MLQKDSGELLLVADHCLDVRLIGNYAKYYCKIQWLVATRFLGVSCYLIKSSLINQNVGLIFKRHLLCGWWLLPAGSIDLSEFIVIPPADNRR